MTDEELDAAIDVIAAVDAGVLQSLNQHQITLQRSPEEVLPLERQGKRHFGVILPWAE
jgi:hypothetical protein